MVLFISTEWSIRWNFSLKFSLIQRRIKLNLKGTCKRFVLSKKDLFSGFRFCSGAMTKLLLRLPWWICIETEMNQYLFRFDSGFKSHKNKGFFLFLAFSWILVQSPDFVCKLWDILSFFNTQFARVGFNFCTNSPLQMQNWDLSLRLVIAGKWSLYCKIGNINYEHDGIISNRRKTFKLYFQSQNPNKYL